MLNGVTQNEKSNICMLLWLILPSCGCGLKKNTARYNNMVFREEKYRVHRMYIVNFFHNSVNWIMWQIRSTKTSREQVFENEIIGQ